MLTKIKKPVAVLILLLFGVVGLAGCGGSESGSPDSSTVVVASKNFNENILLGEILAQLIEAKTDLKVERKLNLGGTMICWQGLRKGDVDLYPDYTGTGLTAILKHDVIKDPDAVYNLVQKEYQQKYKIKWTKPYGFNNTYATAVTQELAQKHHLNSNSDLARVAPQLVFGSDQEFQNRQDGYDNWIATYGLKFKEVKAMDVSLKYKAVAEKKIDVIDAYSTDGELKTYNLKVLADDKNYFPPYYGATIVRMDTLKEHPQLEGVLNLLAGKISDQTMQEMNYRVKEKGQSVHDVAQEFLKDNQLI